jgi:hypothetical protein
MIINKSDPYRDLDILLMQQKCFENLLKNIVSLRNSIRTNVFWNPNESIDKYFNLYYVIDYVEMSNQTLLLIKIFLNKLFELDWKKVSLEGKFLKNFSAL